MTATEAAEIVALLTTNYSVPQWSAEQLKLFRRLISDLDYEPAMMACERWLKTRGINARPSPGDFREAVAAMLQEMQLIPRELAPGEAWAYLRKCMSKLRADQPFPDTYPVVAETVRQLVWRDILQSSDKLDVLRAQFDRYYKTNLQTRTSLRTAAKNLRLPDDAKILKRQLLVEANQARREALEQAAQRPKVVPIERVDRDKAIAVLKQIEANLTSPLSMLQPVPRKQQG